MKIRSSSLLALGALFLALACGGGGSKTESKDPAPHAAVLHYTAPANLQPGDYYLDVDGGQDSRTLTLKVVSPSGGQARGLGFFLSADAAKVAWASAGGSDPYLREGSTFDLGAAPHFIRGRVSGGDLQGGLFQKGMNAAATLNRSPLVYLSLGLKDGAPAGPVRLEPMAGFQAEALGAAGGMEPVTLRIGTLEIR